jgi:hypothetical protein
LTWCPYFQQFQPSNPLQQHSTETTAPHRTALRTAPRAIMIGYHDIDGILAFMCKKDSTA